MKYIDSRKEIFLNKYFDILENFDVSLSVLQNCIDLTSPSNKNVSSRLKEVRHILPDDKLKGKY